MIHQCLNCRHILATEDKFCSQCGAPVAGIAPATYTSRSRSVIALRISIALSWLICLIGLLLVVTIDAETVVASAPVLALSAALIFILSLIYKNYIALALSIAHFGLIALFVVLVITLSWSPNDAQVPFSVMGAIYNVIILPPVFFAIRHKPPTSNPWACVTCGYLLYGIEDNACPECGTSVPAEILRMPDPEDSQLAKV